MCGFLSSSVIKNTNKIQVSGPASKAIILEVGYELNFYTFEEKQIYQIMLRLIKLFTLVFVLFSLETIAQEKKHKINYEKEGYVKALVIKYEVESCGYLIELDNREKTKIAPYKLPDEFKKDKEKVWIKYTLAKKQLPSTCMAGKQADIEDIKKRK